MTKMLCIAMLILGACNTPTPGNRANNTTGKIPNIKKPDLAFSVPVPTKKNPGDLLSAIASDTIMGQGQHISLEVYFPSAGDMVQGMQAVAGLPGPVETVTDTTLPGLSVKKYYRRGRCVEKIINISKIDSVGPGPVVVRVRY